MGRRVGSCRRSPAASSRTSSRMRAVRRRAPDPHLAPHLRPPAVGVADEPPAAARPGWRPTRAPPRGLVRAYKTPSLRNVAGRAPFLHAGQIASLADVVAHYDRAPAAPLGHREPTPPRLTAEERGQLEAFLRTLTGPLDAPDGWLDAPTPR